jgi:hypothetical protein
MSKNGNNYSHFFIQSIKYVSNFLQSIFDDKKKDFYFQFIKILKKIKNEAFLRGLMNQKKLNSLNRTKDNDSNNSQNVIFYNENYNDDISNLDSKNNDEKDTYKNDDNTENNKNNEDCFDENLNNINIQKSTDENRNNKSPNNFCLLNEDKDNSDNDKILKRNKSSNNLKENKNKICYSALNTSRQNYENKNKKNKNKKIDDNKLKKIFENVDDYKNLRLIKKHLEIWNKIKNEYKENNFNDKNEDIDINLEDDKNKNMTISEACRGLNDVILYFKLHLVKYCLKNNQGK